MKKKKMTLEMGGLQCAFGHVEIEVSLKHLKGTFCREIQGPEVREPV